MRVWEFDPREIRTVDSFYVENENFRFNVSDVKGGLCLDIFIEEEKKPTRFVFIEQGEKIKIEGDIDISKSQIGEDVIDLTVKGGKSHKELLQKEIDIEKNQNSLSYIEEIIKTDSTSLLTPVFILISNNNEKYFDALSVEIKSSYYGAKVAKRIAKRKLSSEGENAIDFVCIDLYGNEFKLFKSESKYIILDFWASWCKPCRASHPELIKLYEKYHDHGLEIVSVSIDRYNVQAWKQAIEKDNIGKWIHMLDESCTNLDISDKYNVRFIPLKVVIDSDGNIIKRTDSKFDEGFEAYIDGLFRK